MFMILKKKLNLNYDFLSVNDIIKITYEKNFNPIKIEILSKLADHKIQLK